MGRLACLLAALLIAPAARAGFTVETLAPGVIAFVRTEPAGMMFDANNLAVIGEDAVLVVDSNATGESSREVIRALRRITPKPVRYLVNTHWHLDHFEGNAAWREAYPGLEIVGHEATRQELAGIGARNRAGMLEFGPGMVEALRKRVAGGRDRGGRPLDAETKAAYASDADQAGRYLEATRSVLFLPPTIEVRDRLTIRLGARTVEVIHPGPGHTRADLVVWLPAERIVATGDLVALPVPLIGNTARPLEYPATLERVLGLQALVYLPGHGPVIRDDAPVRRVLALVKAIRDGVKASVAAGETLEETRRRVDLAAFRESFAGTSRWRGTLFDMYVVQPALEAAWRQAHEAS
ncbi:MAG: MBL fold metallo-hydrolase [Betaproteobacteria bacterium]|nr:MBL fold metallo-hydrolase [Betaproteobacteria bacterium]